MNKNSLLKFSSSFIVASLLLCSQNSKADAVVSLVRDIINAVPSGSFKASRLEELRRIHPNASELSLKKFLAVEKLIAKSSSKVKGEATKVAEILAGQNLLGPDSEKFLDTYLKVAAVDAKKAEAMADSLQGGLSSSADPKLVLQTIEKEYSVAPVVQSVPSSSKDIPVASGDTASKPTTILPKHATKSTAPVSTPTPSVVETASTDFPEVDRMAKRFADDKAAGNAVKGTKNLYKGVDAQFKGDVVEVLSSLQGSEMYKAIKNSDEAKDNLATIISYRLRKGESKEDIIKFFKEGVGKDLKTPDALAGLSELNWQLNNLEEFAAIVMKDKGHPLNAQTATHYNKDGSLKPRPAHRNDITDAQWKIEAEDALAEAKVKKFL
nr:hypothetical protein [Pseudomonadota bacterium]